MNDIQRREWIVDFEVDDDGINAADTDEQENDRLGSLMNCGWGQIMIGAMLLTLMFFVAVLIGMGAASQLSH